MRCSAVGAPKMAFLHDWKPTDSTGPHQSLIRPGCGITILAEAGKLSIVKMAANRRKLFRFDVSGSDDSYRSTHAFATIQEFWVTPDKLACRNSRPEAMNNAA